MPNQRDTQAQQTNTHGSAGRESAQENDLAREYLRLAEQCHRSSADFLDQNYRQQWETNLAHFNNEHAPGSHFHKDAYKNRHRLFRPKTRAIAMKGEAALVRAMFATRDVLAVRAENENDPVQVISAEINQELANYRLKKTIPWYKTAVGAWQDSFNFGICVAFMYWDFAYKKVKEKLEGVFDDAGDPVAIMRPEITRNRPWIDLLPPENFRFDSGADWRDVVGTSPFLERIVPLPLIEVRARMNSGDWFAYKDGEIIAASKSDNEEESIRMARAGRQRQDPLAKDGQAPGEFETIFCREYFIRNEDGDDIVFWTIGHQLLLSEPKPLAQVYKHGLRPFVVGSTILEAHKVIPKSKNELVSPIQQAINTLTNQRFDNVSLVLNKRYFMRRGQNIDTLALMRNVPGGGVYMDDPDSDVKVVTTPDVTSSSYEEHNRLAVEMDELAGNFSTASVQTNRQMGETVGGMQLNRASSDEITEYAIVTFVKTFVEPLLQMLVKLEQMYEDDEVIIALAAGQSEHYQKLAWQGSVPEQLLMQDLSVTVDVGIGNTDPTQRVEAFVKNLAATLNVMPHIAPRLDEEYVIKQVMGSSGRDDGLRILKPEDQVMPPPEDPSIVIARMRLQADMAKTEQDGILRAIELEQDNDQFYAKLALEKEITMEELFNEIGNNQIETGIKKAELALKTMAEFNKQRELQFKATTGRDGI